MKHLLDNHYIMEQDEYRGITYTVCFCKGGWFTCYLDVTDTPLNNIGYNNINLSVWCGLTWSDCRYPYQHDDTDRWIIGWDYGHCNDAYEKRIRNDNFGDCLRYEGMGNIHHTLPSLIEDCKQAIDEILVKGEQLCSNDYSQ